MSIKRKPAAVSIDTELYLQSRARAKALGYSTWSAYVVDLITADLSAAPKQKLQQQDESSGGVAAALDALAARLSFLEDKVRIPFESRPTYTELKRRREAKLNERRSKGM